jgi:hypothetical protein
MKHGHFPAFFSILRVLFRQWGEFLDFGEGIVKENGFLGYSSRRLNKRARAKK